MTHRSLQTRLRPCASSILTIAFTSACGVPAAWALSLGGEQVTSALGQPLRMAIPLLGSTADALDTSCYRVVSSSRSDGLPVVTQARVELQTNTNPPQLIVRSARAVDEPIVRITIEAGCDAPLRREYTLFLDPPALQAPEPRVVLTVPAPTLPIAVERAPMRPPAAESVPSKNATQSADRAPTRQRRKPVDAATVAKAPLARKAERREKSTALVATAKQLQQDKLEVQGGLPAGVSSPAEIASLSALAVPRLRIASDLVFLAPPVNQAGGAAVDELQAAIAKDRRARLLAAPIDSDLAPRLEADLVVAQRRLAELQTQLAAAGVVAKSEVATPAAKTATRVPTTTIANASDFDWQRWAWIPGLLLVAGLAGFLLRQRRNQTTTQFATAATSQGDESTDEAITVVRAERTDSVGKRVAHPSPPDTKAAATVAAPAITATPITLATKTPNPIIATRDEREASDRLNNPLFQLRDTESHVDVTELSQVTDEAQVYADLGRNDQAIEILRDHIDSQSSELSSPAPWLMIFELYRRTNNRQGYDELAPQFRKHFNGRVPEWDNYGHELALDDGLEAFPHLVARIERDWGTGEARKFLEELLYDNRGGSRLGFSLAAYRDILLLLQVHEGLSAEPNSLMAATDWESRGANDSDGTPKWDLSLEMIEPPKSGELESFFNRPPPDKS